MKILVIVMVLSAFVLDKFYAFKNDRSAVGNALVKFTAFMDAVSGKVAGTVFARNKGGAYARGKGNPTNPQTARQSAVRSIFALISQRWRGLVAEQRKAWDSSTDDYPYQNRLGETKTLSGAGLHQKLNLNLNSIGEDFISAPQLPRALELPTAFGASVAVPASTMTLEGDFLATTQDTTKFAVFATESSSPGRTNLKNRLRQIDVLTSTELQAGANVWDAYVAVFGVPVNATNIAFELRPVDVATGQGSAPFYTVITVGA